MKATLNTLTGLTDTQLFWLRTNAGMAFALHHTDGDKEAAALLKECPAYWEWWVNHAAHVERQFVENYKDNRTHQDTLLKVYEQDLSPERIMAHPSRRVIELAMQRIWSDAWSTRSIADARVKVLKSNL